MTIFNRKKTTTKLNPVLVTKRTIEGDFLNHRIAIYDIDIFSVRDCHEVSNFLFQNGRKLHNESLPTYAALLGFIIQAQRMHSNETFYSINNL